MLEGINGCSSINSRFWFSCSDGGRTGLLRLLCMANDNEYNRPSSARNERHNYKINRSTSFIRPRHDTITTKSQYSITAKRAGGIE